MVEYDFKFNVGFVANEKRVNVAISRAMDLCVIIGNPNLVGLDEFWRDIIKYTKEIDGYVGCEWDENAAKKKAGGGGKGRSKKETEEDWDDSGAGGGKAANGAANKKKAEEEEEVWE